MRQTTHVVRVECQRKRRERRWHARRQEERQERRIQRADVRRLRREEVVQEEVKHMERCEHTPHAQVQAQEVRRHESTQPGDDAHRVELAAETDQNGEPNQRIP